MLINKDVFFGQQNFFFTDSDETDLTYDYVAYVSAKGAILLARFPKDGSAARYYLCAGVYTSVWANRKGSGSPTYVLPNEVAPIKF